MHAMRANNVQIVYNTYNNTYSVQTVLFPYVGNARKLGWSNIYAKL